MPNWRAKPFCSASDERAQSYNGQLAPAAKAKKKKKTKTKERTFLLSLLADCKAGWRFVAVLAAAAFAMPLTGGGHFTTCAQGSSKAGAERREKRDFGELSWRANGAALTISELDAAGAALVIERNKLRRRRRFSRSRIRFGRPGVVRDGAGQ